MNLVATFNLGEVDYAEYTIPLMRTYASRCAADFIEHKQFPRRDSYPPSASWYHLEAIRNFAAQSYYTKLLLLDADQLILPGCPDLFEMTATRVRAVVDMGLPDGGDFASWCRYVLHEDPAPGAYFNAGMILMPLSEARRIAPFLEGPYPDVNLALHEQHFLNQRLRQHLDVDWLPSAFNWLAPQFIDASLQQQIVHFVGKKKGLLPEFLARLSQRERAAVVTLAQLGERFGTDKGTDHSYLDVYEQLLDPLRSKHITMLEIGIAGGASLRMWRSWFSAADIYGLDVNIESVDAPGCKLIQGNQTDRILLDSQWSDNTFDLIIDDGSHQLEQQLLSLSYLWPKLKTGGMYLIEDLEGIEFVKYFGAFRPLVLDRRSRRDRQDDILLVLMK